MTIGTERSGERYNAHVIENHTLAEQGYCWLFFTHKDADNYLVSPKIIDGEGAAFIGGWDVLGNPRTREDVLFLLEPGTLVPVMDSPFMARFRDYCKETGEAGYAVPGYGYTIPVMMAYKSG